MNPLILSWWNPIEDVKDSLQNAVTYVTEITNVSMNQLWNMFYGVAINPFQIPVALSEAAAWLAVAIIFGFGIRYLIINSNRLTQKQVFKKSFLVLAAVVIALVMSESIKSINTATYSVSLVYQSTDGVKQTYGSVTAADPDFGGKALNFDGDRSTYEDNKSTYLLKDIIGYGQSCVTGDSRQSCSLAGRLASMKFKLGVSPVEAKYGKISGKATLSNALFYGTNIQKGIQYNGKPIDQVTDGMNVYTENSIAVMLGQYCQNVLGMADTTLSAQANGNCFKTAIGTDWSPALATSGNGAGLVVYDSAARKDVLITDGKENFAVIPVYNVFALLNPAEATNAGRSIDAEGKGAADGWRDFDLARPTTTTTNSSAWTYDATEQEAYGTAMAKLNSVGGLNGNGIYTISVPSNVSFSKLAEFDVAYDKNNRLKVIADAKAKLIAIINQKEANGQDSSADVKSAAYREWFTFWGSRLAGFDAAGLKQPGASVGNNTFLIVSSDASKLDSLPVYTQEETAIISAYALFRQIFNDKMGSHALTEASFNADVANAISAIGSNISFDDRILTIMCKGKGTSAELKTPIQRKLADMRIELGKNIMDCQNSKILDQKKLRSIFDKVVSLARSSDDQKNVNIMRYVVLAAGNKDGDLKMFGDKIVADSATGTGSKKIGQLTVSSPFKYYQALLDGSYSDVPYFVNMLDMGGKVYMPEKVYNVKIGAPDSFYGLLDQRRGDDATFHLSVGIPVVQNLIALALLALNCCLYFGFYSFVVYLFLTLIKSE